MLKKDRLVIEASVAADEMRDGDNEQVELKRKKARLWASVQDVAGWVGLAFIAVFFILHIFWGRVNNVSGSSMEPTLSAGDTIVATYSLNDLERGDIVIAKPEAMQKKSIIKRVVAVEGDTIVFDGTDVYLNGELMKEDYIADEITRGYKGEVSIPEGFVYLMGDNRDDSVDSRVIGAVSIEDVKSIVVARHESFGRFERFE